MKALLVSLQLAAVTAAIAYGQPEAAPVVSSGATLAEGLAVAQEIIAQRPLTNATSTGVLHIRSDRSHDMAVPVRFEISIGSADWKSSYSTTASNRDATTLVVTHPVGQPNGYTLGGSNLTVSQTMVPFAGSDFWVADLGLEFFQWREQHLIKKEIRRGRSCRVLESVNPEPGTDGYSRVVSWVDRETSGIVYAEAYDRKGKLLKEFSPKDFKKVNGQWQLQEMEMRNVQTGSRSQIEFDLGTGQ